MTLQLEPLPRESFPETWRALEDAVGEAVAPGFVVGIWRSARPGHALVGAAGRLRTFPPGTSAPMTADTVFDLSSVTKIMATAPLVGRLVDRGWLRFDDPVRAFLPEFPHAGVRIKHLLAHTSGLPAWIPLWQRIRERAGGPERSLETISIAERQHWAREIVTAVPLERPLGQAAVYSDLSFLLLGFILEEVLGVDLDRAVQKGVWAPMGIDTAFFRRIPGICPVPLETIAPTEDCPWRKRVLQGEVHDDNAWSMGGYAGHAGAFGDARAVLGFARALVTGGYLTRETRRAMWTRASEPPGCERTLGWDTPSGDEPAASRLFSPSSVGHLGFTGTSLWIDPDPGPGFAQGETLAVTLLSNRVHPTRGAPDRNPPPKIRAFRPLLHAAVRRDLTRPS